MTLLDQLSNDKIKSQRLQRYKEELFCFVLLFSSVNHAMLIISDQVTCDECWTTVSTRHVLLLSDSAQSSPGFPKR